MARIIIDGKEVFAKIGQTILEVCRENGIYIPTLCYDDQLKPLGSCQICLVELEEHSLVASCATLIADCMVIQSNNSRITSARKQCLESLLFDHYADCVSPCQDACPIGVDVQGYIALIARGAHKEAIELIKETLPLPAVIGRICPHPCEEACPMGIPVRRLYRKVRKSVKDLFGYVPGEKEEEKGPLEFLGDGSYELPGAGK